MSRHLFHSAVLLLLVVLCGTSGAAHAVQAGTDVDPFIGIGWKSSQWEAPTKANEKLFSLRVPSLVEVNNDVFFVAEALCKGKGESCSRTGIASRHLDLTDDKPKEILTEDTSLVMQFPEGVATGTVEAKETMRPTTVVSGDSVYMLLRNQSVTPSVGKSAKARDWGLLLVKGSVSGGNEITWNETHAVTFGNDEYVAKFLTQLVSGGGSGIKTKDGTLMFPMQATDEDGKTSLLSMRFDKSEKKWKLSHETDVDGCRDPTIVEWGDDRFLMMASCERGYRDVYGSTESGRNWFPYGETLTRVWGNSLDRKGHGVQNGFIKVTIEKKDVMLVTLPVYSKDNRESNKQKGRLHLWVTDNSRVHDVGPISREDDDAAASSLLMKSGNEKLISVYENKNGDDGSYSLVAVSLREQLERIKSVVKTWAALDTAFESCRSGSSATVDPRKKGMCAGPVPTDGLVGFLSGNFSDNKWKDEYLCVNATVNNGEPRVPNGLTFKGPGAGAVWPVGDMGQNVAYYFANNKFTLVATVSIHEVPKEGSSPIPLMGVIMKDTSSTALFGLSYTHEKRWRFTLPNGTYEGADDDEDYEDDEVAEDYEDYEDYEHYEYYEGRYNWQPNKTYQVMLQMDASEWDVYVDRMQVFSGYYNWDLFKDHRVSHIYFGAENKEGSESSHLTVSNVLLYNRIIYGREIAKLRASKVPIPNPGEESRSVPEIPPRPTGEFEATPVKRNEEHLGSHAALGNGDTERQNTSPNNVLAPEAPSASILSASTVRIPSPGEEFSIEKEEETPSSPEEEEAEQEVEEAHPRPQSSVEAPEASDAAAVSSGGRGLHGTREEETETDGSSGSASPPASSSVGTSAHSGDDGMGVRESTSLQEEVPPPLGTEDIPKADVERPIYEEEATSPEGTTERQTQETTASLVENGDGEDVGTAPGNASTQPGKNKIPSESNATLLSDTGILPGHEHLSELSAMALFAESTVHGCVSRVLLLLLLGLWGTAALC
ncbi:putative trans-sialidase, Group VIII [Trypanosoma cruzi]|uniref:Trans-sialidase, putative n=2 Tax=Trypanosoma cruzi TaxID=5693 RepID=Q4DYM3_TRYCC|nr:trans-sialidase, putative [Trypanosoma cruzi]EAN97639.1 trans-sialidase, putative [Trypanosoma cruzi]PWV12162.1 putative trans-sialidase, Group VIII [Trypanosoma cruzi]|eukprot:XP_819490.1 trans-sialidase [Trypanosoma cruzi strain CL Brener]